MHQVIRVVLELLRSVDFRKLIFELLDAWTRFNAGEEVDVVVVTLDRVRVTVDIKKLR